MAKKLEADDTTQLPRESEIASSSSPDGERAIQHFSGKTLAEAEELFATAATPLTYTEGLLWMKPVGFRFYVQAAIRYCLSDRASGDADMVNGLGRTISSWRKHQPSALIPIAGLLAEFCASIDRQFERYDAKPHIYVGLRAQYQELAKYFSQMAAEQRNT